MAAAKSPKPSRSLKEAIADARRQTRAERNAAVAAHRAARNVPPPKAGWDKRKPPKKPQGKAALAVDQRIDQQKDARARACPATAAEEARLAAARAKIERDWDHKRHGTAPTLEHAQRNQTGPLRRLWLSGGIDADQLAAAVDIAEIAEAIQADVSVRTASLETRIDSGRCGDAGFESLGRVRREMAYTKWRGERGREAALVLEMIVGGANGPVGSGRSKMNSRCSSIASALLPRTCGAIWRWKISVVMSA